MSHSLLVLLCAFLSVTLIYSTAVTTDFKIDGKADDWDSAKVAATFSKGASYNQINMQSTGLHAFACANQITFCSTEVPWIGSLRTLSPFESTVSIVGSLLFPARATTSSKVIGNCDARRGTATKTFLFPAVVSQSGNLRVTTVAASPLPYESTQITPVEEFKTGRTFKLTFSKTFPSTTEWSPIPTSVTAKFPECSAALPGRGFTCPSGVFYYKKFGIVFLSGLFLSQDPSSATRANPIFATLPADARPQYDNDYVVACDTNSIGYITVKTTGEVIFRGRATKWCSLDGVSYLFASDIPAAGSGTSSFSLQFGALFRGPTADSRSPVVAITKDFGLQFLTPFQNGVGSILATLTTPSGSCESSVEIQFPVVIDSQLAFAKSTAYRGTLTFSLETSSTLSAPNSDFRRAFAAHNTATGTFAILLQGYDASSPLFTVLFTFSNAQGSTIAAAIYTPLTKTFSLQNGQATFNAASSAFSAPFFELAFTESSLVQAGNKVQVTFGFDSFTYSF